MKKAFAFVELLVVITIMGVLVGLPPFWGPAGTRISPPGCMHQLAHADLSRCDYV